MRDPYRLLRIKAYLAPPFAVMDLLTFYITTVSHHSILLLDHKLFIPFSDSLSFSVPCLLESVTVPFHQIKNLDSNPFRFFLSFSSRLYILLLLLIFSLKMFPPFESLIGTKSFIFVRNCGSICVLANGIVAEFVVWEFLWVSLIFGLLLLVCMRMR